MDEIQSGYVISTTPLVTWTQSWTHGPTEPEDIGSTDASKLVPSQLLLKPVCRFPTTQSLLLFPAEGSLLKGSLEHGFCSGV